MESDRAFATHLVEAPALAVSFVVPLAHKLTGVEMAATLTVVVDASSIGEEGASQIVSSRQAVEGEIMDNCSREVVHVEGAAG